MRHEAHRIVSLLPGATEWICRLGLGRRLVGVSHQCDFPPDVNALPRVTHSRLSARGSKSVLSSAEIDAAVRSHSQSRTPLYDLDTETVAALKPDLIVTQSLCNVCAVSERDVRNSLLLIGDGCRVLDLRAQTFREILTDATLIAEACGGHDESIDVIHSLRRRIGRVREAAALGTGRTPTVTLLEWLEPLFCAGHWTPELIDWAGGRDPIGRVGQPSGVISTDELFAADPDILLVACCGRDAETTREELSSVDFTPLRCVKTGNVHVFDGSAYFNRPGPRLVDSLESVASLVRRWREQAEPRRGVPLSS